MTTAHEEKETLTVEVNIPEHADRVTTSLFTRTRKQLIALDGECYICGAKDGDKGPLEAHHFLERSLAEMLDWKLIREAAEAGELGFTERQRQAAKAFDWDGFMSANPFDPYRFIDDMTVNGVLLDKEHHTAKDSAIHTLPFPLLLGIKYGKEGYNFSAVEIIHHQE